MKYTMKPKYERRRANEKCKVDSIPMKDNRVSTGTIKIDEKRVSTGVICIDFN